MQTMRFYIFLLLTATWSISVFGISPELPLPEVPSSLRTPETRAAYVVAHYFDSLERMPSLVLANTDWIEENFANFLGLVPYAADSAEVSAKAAMAVLVKHTDIHQIDELAEIYLHNPDSPSYDDYLYAAWLQTAITISPDDIRREIFAHKAEVAARNLPGTRAMDFPFTLLPGHEDKKVNKLADISGEKLLIFFDPDCSSCRKVISRLANDSKIRRAVEDKSLTVLAIYHDAEVDKISDAVPLIPQQWIGGYDEGTVSDEELYELILAPTIYRIDGEGIVLQRNPSLKDIIIPSNNRSNEQ